MSFLNKFKKGNPAPPGPPATFDKSNTVLPPQEKVTFGNVNMN